MYLFTRKLSIQRDNSNRLNRGIQSSPSYFSFGATGKQECITHAIIPIICVVISHVVARLAVSCESCEKEIITKLQVERRSAGRKGASAGAKGDRKKGVHEGEGGWERGREVTDEIQKKWKHSRDTTQRGAREGDYILDHLNFLLLI